MTYLQVTSRLKQLRMEKGLTQAQVARRIGITRSTLSAYENGTRYPSYDILISLAHFFGVPTDYLLGVDKRRFVDVSGLNEQEVAAIANMVNLLRAKNEERLLPYEKAKVHVCPVPLPCAPSIVPSLYRFCGG